MQKHTERIIHTDRLKPYRRVLPASSLAKDSVRNRRNDDIGSIKEIMIDIPSGRIAYAVLSVGGFFNIGDRLFTIPREALTPDEDRQYFVMDVDKEWLESAPGL
jgi:sporulation protein YlmC with PRC-barrel domain